MSHPAQLTLRLAERPHPSFDNFVVGTNGAALDALRMQNGNVWLWGGAGCGRSHLLLAAAAETAGGRYVHVMADAGPLQFERLEGADLLALDDIDTALPNRPLEERLIQLLDQFRTQAGRIVFSARVPPAEAAAALPDLTSRLAGAAVFRLHPPGDAELSELIIERLRMAGLIVAPAVVAWLLRRAPRDPHTLRAFIDQLANAAVTRQREVTIPFARELFGEQLGA